MDILILTSVYPQKDDLPNAGVTPVVHYFAKEWVKTGHNVVVIHNANRYPNIINRLPESFINKVNSKFGIVIPNKYQGDRVLSDKEGVKSYRLPMLKIIPKSKFSDFQIKSQFKKITEILNNIKFKPDLILGHWENPQIPLLSLLKRKYGSRTALVFHSLVYLNQRRYKRSIRKYINEIDVIGARSKEIGNEVKTILSLDNYPFICYSGIPDKYFNDELYRRTEFEDKESDSYLYVGRLIKRKNIHTSINALKQLNTENSFKFDIVGDGAEKKNLQKLISNLDLYRNINLLGYKSRDEIIHMMDKTEVFIMVSDNETFGLVYLEAMSRGCIVIASKNGGMDGIIKNGVNGFLCEQGNENELYKILKKIKGMSIEEKKSISENGIKTSSNFKDSHVAQNYLENVVDKV